MVIALYLPDDIAEQFKNDRLQGSLYRLRRLAQKIDRAGGQFDGEVLLSTDVKLMQQLEASFCLAREVDKKGEILIDPNDPTRGGKKTTGYNPKDSEDRRIQKACCFYRSMVSKGQSKDDALRIASRYYHVNESDVRNILEAEYDDDVYFMVNGAIPISASEMLDPGDFC